VIQILQIVKELSEIDFTSPSYLISSPLQQEV